MRERKKKNNASVHFIGNVLNQCHLFRKIIRNRRMYGYRLFIFLAFYINCHRYDIRESVTIIFCACFLSLFCFCVSRQYLCTLFRVSWERKKTALVRRKQLIISNAQDDSLLLSIEAGICFLAVIHLFFFILLFISPLIRINYLRFVEITFMNR